MAGGKGDDTYIVDNIGDVIFEAANEGIDHVFASVSYALRVNIENLTLTGAGHIDAVGNRHDNILVGNGGNNALDGRGGDDILIGGLGQDILTGGAGRDTFVFQSIHDSAVAAPDRITDLEAHDIIDLSRIDADATRAGDQAFTLVDAFTNQAGQATLTYANGVTWLNLDVNGDGVSDFLLAIDGNHMNHTGWAW